MIKRKMIIQLVTVATLIGGGLAISKSNIFRLRNKEKSIKERIKRLDTILTKKQDLLMSKMDELDDLENKMANLIVGCKAEINGNKCIFINEYKKIASTIISNLYATDLHFYIVYEDPSTGSKFIVVDDMDFINYKKLIQCGMIISKLEISLEEYTSFDHPTRYNVLRLSKLNYKQFEDIDLYDMYFYTNDDTY